MVEYYLFEKAEEWVNKWSNYYCVVDLFYEYIGCSNPKKPYSMV